MPIFTMLYNNERTTLYERVRSICTSYIILRRNPTPGTMRPK